MTLTGKEKQEDICEHLKKVIKAMIDNNIKMDHDFQGTTLYCYECDSNVCLEAYGDEFTNDDIEEE